MTTNKGQHLPNRILNRSYWDAVAGTQAHDDHTAVLGGLPGLFKRWQSRDLPVRLLAL